MSLQFYFGASGSGKSTLLHQHLIEESKKHPNRNYLIIVPDQFTMQTQRDLVREHPCGGIMNIDVLSFGRLAVRVLESTGTDRIPVLDDTGKSLILQRLAGQLSDQLPVLGPNLSKLGFIHEVKSALSEFAQYGISPDGLGEISEKAGDRKALRMKLQELQVIYRAFQEEIAGKYVTKEERMTLLARQLECCDLVRGSVVAFDGFTGFTPIQYQVIRQILRLAAQVKMSVLIDPESSPYKMMGEQELFFLSRQTVKALQKCAQEEGITEEDPVCLGGEMPRFEGAPELAFLENSLFRYGRGSLEQKPERIHLQVSSTIREEVRQTCINIRHLVRDAGYRYGEIAVVSGDLAGYAHDMEQIFTQFQIPCFVDASQGILLNPFTEYIRSSLGIVIHDFAQDSVLHYLRCGMADFSPEEADLLENFIRERGIRGYSRWKREFVPLKKELRKEEEQVLAEYETLNELRLRLIEGISPLLQSEKNVDSRVRSLYQFLEQGESFSRLAQFAKEFEQKGDLLRAGQYTQVYGMILGVLEQLLDLLGEEEVTADEFLQIINAGFAEIKVGSIPRQTDQVLIGDMERTRLCQVKVLFFLGINDGNIPGATSAGGILSDIDREFLQGMQFELAPTPRQQMFIQRLYLYLNMTKPSDHLYLSYARVNDQGKSMQPSYLIGMMHSLFPKLEEECPEMRPLLDQLESKSDVMHFYASMLRGYTSGAEYDPAYLMAMKKVLHSSYGSLEQVENTAFYTYHPTPLAKEIASLLYGKVLVGSVSRMEQYANCAYAHFLQYGMGLNERREYEFGDSDMGNLFHGVLEQFAQELKERGVSWKEISDEEADQIVERLVRESVEEEFGILKSDARHAYQVERVERILKRSVRTLRYQVGKGSFLPDSFEISFESLKNLKSLNMVLSDTERMRLKGRIDRMDLCREEDKLYVKIIDYKSGSHSFDLAAVYYGTGLQLVVYLNTAVEAQKKKHPTLQVIPAAMLYYKIDDPLVEPGVDAEKEQVQRMIIESLRATGVVNEDRHIISLLDHDPGTKSDVIPVALKKDGSFRSGSSVLSEENLETVSNYVNHKLRTIGRSILDGDIAVLPFEGKDGSSCTYCSFRGICGYDRRIPGFESKKAQKMSDQEILEKMKNEVN